MRYCKYYAFQHECGMYWRKVNDQIMKHDFDGGEEMNYFYHVNLAWDTSKNIRVQLSGCKQCIMALFVFQLTYSDYIYRLLNIKTVISISIDIMDSNDNKENMKYQQRINSKNPIFN